MRIFLTGATGFVGQALVRRLIADGHEVSAWVRDPRAAAARLGPAVALVALAGGDEALAAAIAKADAIVNLAGERILPGRWTAGRKAVLEESRVGVTRRLVAAIGRAPRPPVLVSASAVGFYGDRGDEVVDETATAGGDFLAALCVRWEEAARAAERHGARVVCPRLGLVVGPGGGALAAMLPAFRLGLGGPLGSGRQWTSWVHLDDVTAALALAVTDERLAGPVNVTAPAPVTNADFARALGRALGRPARLRAPGLALRLALGEAAQAVLGGQRAVPRRLGELGFAPRHAELGAALAASLGA